MKAPAVTEKEQAMKGQCITVLSCYNIPFTDDHWEVWKLASSVGEYNSFGKQEDYLNGVLALQRNYADSVINSPSEQFMSCMDRWLKDGTLYSRMHATLISLEDENMMLRETLKMEDGE